MRNIKIFSLNFDIKVKILIAMCLIIATMILSYSCYHILIKNSVTLADNEENILDIENLVNIKSYYADYDVTVSGNKTINTYSVKENVDFLNSIYDSTIDDVLNIVVTKDSSLLKKEKIDYEYSVDNYGVISTNNPVSSSSVIECIRKIYNSEIEGNIKSIEKDDICIIQITTKNEYIKDIERIEVYILKDNCKLNEIKMYNSDENVLYLMTFKEFVVKK